MDISVIIPTFNEQDEIGRLIASLQQQSGLQLEILVVDGGSSDATVEISKSYRANVLISPSKGRGAQMNYAAKFARSRLLLFLHADSYLESSVQLETAVKFYLASPDASSSAGHFAINFLSPTTKSSSNKPAYFYYEEKTYLNRPETINGDQALLIDREFFYHLGGHDESMPFLEDQRISKKIFAQGRWILLPGKLGTSTRRFEREGFSRRMVLSALIMGLDHISYQEFFVFAPQIYRDENHSCGLKNQYFCLLILKLMYKRGIIRSFKDWLQIGSYVFSNAWQMGLFLDVILYFLCNKIRIHPLKKPNTFFYNGLDHLYLILHRLPLISFVMELAVTLIVFILFLSYTLVLSVHDQIVVSDNVIKE